MSATRAVRAAGWSLHLPGVRPADALAGPFGPMRGDWARADAPPPERAAAVLGRKGLLAKEPATRLALCAVHRALGLPAGWRAGAPVSPRVAVVACGNLGNAGTVADVARLVAAEGGRAVSILDAPNVSSNIIASTIGQWFGFGGPNLMICSGSTAGLDGLRIAMLLLRAGRADRVVLAGAEPADPVAAALHAAAGAPAALSAGAACVVLEPAPGSGPGPRPGGGPLVEPLVDGLPPSATAIGPDGFDPSAHWGDHYGAEGVVALALGLHLAADEGHDAVSVRCAGPDGDRAALVRRRG